MHETDDEENRRTGFKVLNGFFALRGDDNAYQHERVVVDHFRGVCSNERRPETIKRYIRTAASVKQWDLVDMLVKKLGSINDVGR
jgi:hypothetical protein